MTNENRNALKGHGRTILAVTVVGLGIWVAVLDSRLAKAEEKSDWLEGRVLNVSNRLEIVEYQRQMRRSDGF